MKSNTCMLIAGCDGDDESEAGDFRLIQKSHVMTGALTRDANRMFTGQSSSTTLTLSPIMSRLASLTPSRPPRSSLSPSPSPSSPARPIETTHHRMLKLLLNEVRNLIKTWDELVGIDGLKAGKACVDEVTEME